MAEKTKQDKPQESTETVETTNAVAKVEVPEGATLTTRGNIRFML